MGVSGSPPGAGAGIGAGIGGVAETGIGGGEDTGATTSVDAVEDHNGAGSAGEGVAGVTGGDPTGRLFAKRLLEGSLSFIVLFSFANLSNLEEAPPAGLFRQATRAARLAVALPLVDAPGDEAEATAVLVLLLEALPQAAIKPLAAITASTSGAHVSFT